MSRSLIMSNYKPSTLQHVLHQSHRPMQVSLCVFTGNSVMLYLDNWNLLIGSNVSLPSRIMHCDIAVMHVNECQT